MKQLTTSITNKNILKLKGKIIRPTNNKSQQKNSLETFPTITWIP